MDAALVFDGRQVIVPVSMDKPLPDQCQGTPHEVVGELASRICYDSLGVDPATGKRRGRSSGALHEHILQVQNHSVYEHLNFTVQIDFKGGRGAMHTAATVLNRKGIWAEIHDHHVEITTNARAVLEWERHTKPWNEQPASFLIRDTLRTYGNRLMPQIIGPPTREDVGGALVGFMEQTRLKVDNLSDDQAWITLWLYGSRGFTHEQVRHRFAMSQRSTRYVDEDGSPYIMHPLVSAFLNHPSSQVQNVPVRQGTETVMVSLADYSRKLIETSIEADRETYRKLTNALQRFATEHLGIADKTAARKQARGAARGYLGNALASEMLFSAPVSGWKWILNNRKNKLADAEIREIYSPALAALQASGYGERFAEYKLTGSPDGLGTVLA